MSGRKQVIVVGAGISGLATAFWLRQKGIDAVVIERASRVGGVIRSEEIDGYTVEHAANCLMNFLPEVNHLCETVGLSEQRVFRSDEAAKRYLLKDGRLQAVPLTAREMLTSSFWSWRAKLRMAMEPLIPASGPETEETVADFIRRRFGRELFAQAIDPFVAGTLAGDPERVCVRSTMPRFYEFEQSHGSVLRGVIASRLSASRTRFPTQLYSFGNGMESLPAAIGNYLGDQVRLAAGVQGMERSGRRWRVHGSDGGCSMQWEADVVVLATPAYVSSRFMRPLDKLLADQLGGIAYAPMAAFTLGFRSGDVSHRLDGMGCLIPAREGRYLLGVLWNSSLFVGRAPAGRVSLTCYMGGMRHPDVLDHSDDELLDLALADLRHMLGVRGKPEFAHLIRHEYGLPQYHLGHRQRLALIDERLRLTPGLYLCGNYLDGVSVRDCIARGRRLARQVAAYLDGEERLHPVTPAHRPDTSAALRNAAG